MILGVKKNGAQQNLPKISSFYAILTKHCPDILIRSPRDHVCDTCALYRTKMKNSAPIDVTEELGKHTEHARQMRYV